GQTSVANVILNADSEMIFRRSASQIVINRFDHCRREFFGGKSISSAHNRRRSFPWAVSSFHAFVQRVNDIYIERFANRSRFLGAVKNGNLPHAGWKRLQER